MFGLFAETQTIMPGKLASISIITIICLVGCGASVETGWSKEEFLSYCCAHKAGLAADAWKDPETEVYLFTADVFGAPFKDT